MSDRTRVLTVVLEDDYRVDDVTEITKAIKMIKGVSEVGINVTNVETYVAYTKARTDLLEALFKVLEDSTEKKKQ